ncbi:MAG: tRNA pseudouridine(55) synthase TruB, partial [Spirochaetales bacterium]|nr:tRNA pseudouridine(55) synthase TruB [Spirochaetales bacterium]
MKPIATETQFLDRLVLLDKPRDVTSFQALSPLKKDLGSSLGHTGTLDRFADGLLVILTGHLTKLVPLLTEMDKVYEAVFEFGRQTDTLDPEGQVILERAVPTRDRLEETLKRFQGDLLQVPPLFSAVHVNGKRAYKRALAGESPEIPPRHVKIHAFEMLHWEAPYARVRIHCSKGTYVRALARYWAESSDSAATVTQLRRLQVGPFVVPRVGREDWNVRRVFETLQIPVFKVKEPLLARRGV